MGGGARLTERRDGVRGEEEEVRGREKEREGRKEREGWRLKPGENGNGVGEG